VFKKIHCGLLKFDSILFELKVTKYLIILLFYLILSITKLKLAIRLSQFINIK